MTVDRGRVATMKQLVASSPIAGQAVCANVCGEFDEVVRANRLQPLRRARLLQVLHSTRALDSFLAAFLDSYGCRGGSHSLGGYLVVLESHQNNRLGRLRQGKARHYQRTIVDKRNVYMHKAGSNPANGQEVIVMLREMETCLSEVVALSTRPTGSRSAQPRRGVLPLSP